MHCFETFLKKLGLYSATVCTLKKEHKTKIFVVEKAKPRVKKNKPEKFKTLENGWVQCLECNETYSQIKEGKLIEKWNI